MRRHLAVGLLVLTVLSSLAFAGEAWARAGGGGSSGSRGGRSSTAPAQRAATTPGRAAPAPPAESAAPRGGDGLAGGFLTRGLLGGLLFGGSNGGSDGGVGLLDIVALGMLASTALRILRAGSGVRRGPSVDVWADPSGHLAPDRRALAAGLDDDRSGPTRRAAALDEGDVTTMAAETFARVLAARSAGDLASVAPLLTPEIQSFLQSDATRLKGRGRARRLEDVAVGAAQVVDAGSENGVDHVAVRIGARVCDYVVDARTGEVVEGDPAEPVALDETWTFARPAWAKPWRLSAIQRAATAAR